MSTETFTLEIFQGETYRALITEADENGAPVSNVGHSAKLQVRTRAGDDDVLIELTDSAGLVLGGADGTIAIRIGADLTAELTSDAVYDLRLTNDGDPTEVRYPLAGPVTLRRRVTR